MNTQSNAMPESLDSLGIAPPGIIANRPMYWSIRRELWEHRSIYIAPLAAAVVVLCGFLLSTVELPHKTRTLSQLDPADQREAITMPRPRLPGCVVPNG